MGYLYTCYNWSWNGGTRNCTLSALQAYIEARSCVLVIVAQRGVVLIGEETGVTNHWTLCEVDPAIDTCGGFPH